MVKVVQESLADVECAVLLVEPIAPCGRAGEDPAGAHPGGEAAVHPVHQQNRHRCKKDELLAVIDAYSQAYPDFAAIVPISARKGDGLEELMGLLAGYAQEGPQLFPDGMTTDQADSQVCAETVREKMLYAWTRRIPHGTAVEVTRFSERDNGIIDLDVTIYCEKASHKGIIIGKNGEMIKRISTLARRDIEKFMGTKVYMETWVKVKENWRDNVNFIRSQGTTRIKPVKSERSRPVFLRA